MSSESTTKGGTAPREPEIRSILERVKAVSGAVTDQGLADVLSATRRQVISWKERGNIPWDQLARFAAQHGCGLDWLIYGAAAPGTAEGRGAYAEPTVETLTSTFRLLSESEDLSALFERASPAEKAVAINAIAQLVDATGGEVRADLIAQITRLGMPDR